MIGLVFGRATTTHFSFTVNPNNIPKFGEFVTTKNRDGEIVLGTVKEIVNVNKLIEDDHFSFEYLLKHVGFSKRLIEQNDIVIATARVLGVVENGEIKPNRVPIMPSSEVRLASDELLKEIFRCDENSIIVGNLLARENVEVGLNVKELVLRHFAILSITGGGKSNTACVIMDQIVRNFGGTIVLIDPHGEYVEFTFSDGSCRKKRVLPVGIRPEILEPWEFASLLGVGKDANVQRLHLERMFTTAKHEGFSGKDFVDRILELAENWIEIAENDGDVTFLDYRGRERFAKLSRQRDLNSLLRIRDYVMRFQSNYENLLTSDDILANMRTGHLNVVNLSGFDENQMRIIVSYILRNVLNGRIRYLRGRTDVKRFCPIVEGPVLIVIEEGHIFAPKGEDSDVVKWLSRIAREGRKFGVGIGIISQRPKRINEDILSQCNTKIVLRIVEPNDQRYVQQASEQISEDLLNDIASLGRGEAVIVGSAVKLPVAVKIKKYRGRYGGRDIEVVEEWRRLNEREKVFKNLDLIV